VAAPHHLHPALLAVVLFEDVLLQGRQPAWNLRKAFFGSSTTLTSSDPCIMSQATPCFSNITAMACATS
jgi:hypothetical protein